MNARNAHFWQTTNDMPPPSRPFTSAAGEYARATSNNASAGTQQRFGNQGIQSFFGHYQRSTADKSGSVHNNAYSPTISSPFHQPAKRSPLSVSAVPAFDVGIYQAQAQSNEESGVSVNTSSGKTTVDYEKRSSNLHQMASNADRDNGLQTSRDAQMNETLSHAHGFESNFPKPQQAAAAEHPNPPKAPTFEGIFDGPDFAFPDWNARQQPSDAQQEAPRAGDMSPSVAPAPRGTPTRAMPSEPHLQAFTASATGQAEGQSALEHPSTLEHPRTREPVDIEFPRVDESAFKELNAAYEKAMTECNRMREIRAMAKASLLEKSRLESYLKNEIVRIGFEVRTSEQHAAELREELFSANNKLEQAHQDLSKCAESVKEKAGENEQLKKQVETLQSCVRGHDTKMEMLNQENEGRIQGFEQAQTKGAMRLKELDEESKNLREQIGHQKGQLELLQTTFREMHEEKSKMEAQHAALQQACLQKQAQEEKIMAAKQELARKVSELEGKLVSLEAQILEHVKDKNELERQKTDMQRDSGREIVRLNERIQEMEGQKEEVERQKAELQQETSQRLTDLKNRVRDLEKKEIRMAEDVRQAQTQMDDECSRADKAHEQLKIMKERLDAKDKALEEVRHQLKSCEKAQAKCDDELERAKGQHVEDLHQARIEYERKLKDLEQKYEKDMKVLQEQKQQQHPVGAENASEDATQSSRSKRNASYRRKSKNRDDVPSYESDDESSTKRARTIDIDGVTNVDENS